MKSNRTLFFIALGLFGLFTVEFSVIGLLPTIVERFNISISKAGWLVSWFAAIAATGGPLMVLWLSRYNRRVVMLVSLIIFSLCSALSAWAPNFTSLLMLRIPSALLLPVFFSMAFAAAVALYPPERAAHASSMALIGESAGLVFGLPLITLIEAQLSYEASFLFCSLVCGAAVLGLLSLPSDIRSIQEKNSKTALLILKKPGLWLGLAATVAILGAMFSVYSYATEYLSKIGFSGSAISMLMLVFGVGGVVGNVIAGRTLAKNLILTVSLYPVILVASYILLYLMSTVSLFSMAVICIVWGATHTAGLVISQFWVASSAEEAPEFATSLFVSAANIGVTVGATSGGTLISNFGTTGPILSGWAFSGIALIIVVSTILWSRRF